MEPIGRIFSDFPTKFGIPRQAGLVDSLEATLVFEEKYRNPDALRGLEGFSHLWLIWEFSEIKQENWIPTVRPPRLGGNTRLGVFATRSPFRPNPIGLSCVRLERIESDPRLGLVLKVSGADLMNGTPVLDIKPYVPYADCHPEATGGFASSGQDYLLTVEFPPELLNRVPANKQKCLRAVLAQDPRPAYHTDPDRIYTLQFGYQEIKFRVNKKILTVTGVSQIQED